MYALVVLLQILYAVCVLGLAVYGFHALALTWVARRPIRQGDAAPAASAEQSARLPQTGDSDTDLPFVTIQLPIYNERHVIERLIEACVRQDYPRTRLEIQVLDDSSDQTRVLVLQTVQRWQEAGYNISAVHRADRSGYKAGALAHALPLAQGDFIALFDADFVPPPDFLRRTIPHFLAPDAARVGFVQARWDHLNRDYSPLTASQALALDGHFAVEQEGRQLAGFYFGFNGSAGVWRRACIEDPAVGGWQIDTLCEDLDLSYRAQMAGWQPRYVNDVTAPAEIPPQLSAFKRQQARWAKGSIQTLCKLGGDVWRSDRPLTTRLFALFHLSSYLLHPLLLLLLLMAGPLMLLGVDPAAPLALLSVTTVGPPLLYAAAQWRLHRRRWWRHFAYLPILMLLGTGLCVNNSWAVWQGLRGGGGQFLRTPKFQVERAGDRWQQSAYRLALEPIFFAEFSMLVYALAVAGMAMAQGKWLSAPFLLLYAGGFAIMVTVDLWQARPIDPRHKPVRGRRPLRDRWSA